MCLVLLLLCLQNILGRISNNNKSFLCLLYTIQSLSTFCFPELFKFAYHCNPGSENVASVSLCTSSNEPWLIGVLFIYAASKFGRAQILSVDFQDQPAVRILIISEFSRDQEFECSKLVWEAFEVVWGFVDVMQGNDCIM